MGNSESKLGFKQDVFALAGNDCPPPTHKWWSQFYTLPESAEDVFTLFSQHDIRALTSPSPESRRPNPNLETLIYVCVARLRAVQKEVNGLAANENVPNEVLSCMRLLTRCLPYIYETEALREWEDAFFWKPRKAQHIAARHFVDGLDPSKKLLDPDEEIDRPLGHVLIDLLVRYLFTHGLTLPNKYDENGVPLLKTSWNIWNSGIGCKKSAGMTKENQKNAAEVLSLLLVLCSRQMYNPTVCAAESAIPALQYLTTEHDRQIVLTVLCSLLNTVLKYNPSSWLVNPVGDDPRARLVQLSLQFLTILTVYNNVGTDNKNEYRHQSGRIHKPEDLQFIHQGIITALQSMVSPTSGVASYVPGALRPTAWSPETLVLLWEMLKDNKRFKTFIIETDRVHDLVVMVLCCAVEAKDDLAKHGVLRLCILLLQTLSQDKEFATRLNMPLIAAESLPARLRIPNFHGSYADFLILTLRTIIVTSSGTLESMYAPILFIIDDIAPHVRNLQRATSIRMMALFSALANTDYLYQKRDNPKNLIILLDAFSAILEHDSYTENPRFVEALLRNRKQFYALREFTVDGALAELDRQAQRRKDRASGDGGGGAMRGDSMESLRSPLSVQSPGLRNVPEHDTFAIGEDEDDGEVSDHDGESEVTPLAVAASASVVDETTAPARSMSEKARGKQPAQRQQHHRQTSSLSRTTSTNTSTASLPALLTSSQATASQHFTPSQAWLETWIPYLPLHTILEVCDGHQKQVGSQAPGANSNPTPAPNLAGGMGGAATTGQQPRAASLSLSARPRSAPLTRAPISLAWYLSLIWGLIFAADVAVNKGIRGLWTGTAIKLFNVESREQAITLRSPKGAVDALGDSIAQRLGNLSFVARDGPSPVAMRDV